MNAFPTKQPRRSGTDSSVPKGGFSFNLPFLVLVGFGMHECIPYEAYRHFASISACAGIGESVTLLVFSIGEIREKTKLPAEEDG